MLAGGVQTDATTPNIVGPRMLGVIASVLAGGLQIRMQQLPTSLGPAVHHRKVGNRVCNANGRNMQHLSMLGAKII